jgi:pilus assembly protein CpaB
MRRRLLAAFAALVLALAGGVVLVAYVRGADARAAAGLRTVQVLVVAQLVPAGTPADQLADKVDTELVPAKTAVPGRVLHLADLAGKVAAVDLQPGEQLLAGRFKAPGELRAAGTVDVPAGDQEVSVLLEPQRAVGGRLAAGDKVGVYLSMTDPAATTHGVLHGVLVTQVQGAPAAPSGSTDTETASAGSAAPTGSLLITLAVTAKDAEEVVFGAEHGTLWLSLEPDGADDSGTQVLTPDNVYEGRP